MLPLHCFTLPAALCAALLALPAAAGNVSSFARAYAGGQLCGAGPAPNCVTSLLFKETDAPVEVSAADANGLFRAEQDRSYVDYDGAGTLVNAVQSWALADLNQGNLRLGTAALIRPRPSGSDASVAQPYVFGIASASLGDTFSVQNTDGSAYQGTTASTLSIQLDGTLSGTADSKLTFWASITLARPGYLAALAAHDYDTAGALTIASVGTPWLKAGDSLPPGLSISVPAAMRNFEWAVAATASFNFRQGDEGLTYANADLGHTITVGLQTPDGTIAASASGLFPNTVPMAPVPEPSTWALMLLGGAGLLDLARRRAGAQGSRSALDC